MDARDTKHVPGDRGAEVVDLGSVRTARVVADVRARFRSTMTRIVLARP